MKSNTLILFLLVTLLACNTISKKGSTKENSPLQNRAGLISISRDQYKDQLYGFWLGQCIANWTGLVTEMDK
ncbi:MAG: hypothetical protein ACPG7V_06780, partial [Flavobacteriaceae bacterium]